MIEDSKDLPQGYVLNTQICVVGAGAAGVTLALELADRGLEVTLLEAGGVKASIPFQNDLAGEVLSPGHHAPLTECRSRQLGGTTAVWVGRCLPLEQIDLERRDYVPGSGWPIDYSDLDRYYSRANAYCHAGSYAYTILDALPNAPESIVDGFKDGALIASRIERWSLPTHFGRHYRNALSTSNNIRVQLNSICTEVELDKGQQRVRSVFVTTIQGRRFSVRAQCFILAGGGLETTRLLLASNRSATKGIGNRYDNLGRYYMGHVFGSVAEIQFYGDPRRTIYGLERDREGIYCRRYISPSPEMQRKERLLNTAFWTTNPPAADPDHLNGILSAAYIALSLPILRDKLAASTIQKMFCGESAGKSYLPHIRNVLLSLPRTSFYASYFLYRRFVTERRIPALFVYNPANRYDLYYHAEQAPDRNSRVLLANEVDRFGMRKLQVDLRYSAGDIDSVVRAHKLLARELGDHLGLASIKYKHDDVEEHILEQAVDGYHQIGTTRMAASEREGVVNEHCRVHGVGNLYVCSSSVFPTSGHANPTLTIVALAVRLAHHIGCLFERNGSHDLQD